MDAAMKSIRFFNAARSYSGKCSRFLTKKQANTRDTCADDQVKI